MPDWSYQPLLRHLVRPLPAARRRSVTLGALRLLGALPGSGVLIHLLGHMTPPGSATFNLFGRRLLSRVGVSASIDPDGQALRSLARFGVGWVEIRPTPGNREAIARRRAHLPDQVAVIASTGAQPGDTLGDLIRRVDAVALDLPPDSSPDGLRAAVAELRQGGCTTVLLGLPVAAPDVDVAGSGADGVVLRGEGADLDQLIKALQARQATGIVVVAADVPDPATAQRLHDAGADLIGVSRGWTEAGPGIAKRINEALADPVPAQQRPAWQLGWPWLLLLGIAMIVVGIVVVIVGLTTVVLPYDESFLGVRAPDLALINGRLLAFLRHDRISLGATLLSIGVLFTALAAWGVRRGWLWSRSVVLVSGVAGFGTVFLFLGYGYLDPLNVALSAGLFPFFIIGLLRPTLEQPHVSTDLVNDTRWRFGLLGQLLFAGLGAGLITSGAVITSVGFTSVFVFSDLSFMGTTSDALRAANPHLLPLIAHDRAGFGGTLICDGLGVLLTAIWGFRRGARWIWWTLAVAGGVGFAGGLAAHLIVGYLELGHLAPVFLAGAVFIAALATSHPYLCVRDELISRGDRNRHSRL
jgi:dihydroorotate dehydrogenase